MRRYGVVERSPVSVQFTNASNIGTNQAISEYSRVVIVNVALIMSSDWVTELLTDRILVSSLLLQ